MSDAVMRVGVAQQIKTDPGEIVRWSGAPEPIAYAFRKGSAIFMFGVLAILFSLAPFLPHIPAAPSSAYAMVAIFTAIGLAMLCAPIYHFVRAKRTLYALTDKRAIIDTPAPGARRRSVALDTIDEISLASGIRGTKHVLFVFDPWTGHAEGGAPRNDGFLALSGADGETAERLVRRLAEQCRRAKQ